MGSVEVFRNIRYARASRFGQPQLLGFAEPDACAERGPVSPQAPSRLAMVMGPAAPMGQSEDCQVLSVFTPGRSGSRPVMVWLHGGAFVTGGGEMAWYDGDRLAGEQDVVVVSVTYRLGAFGYLHLPGGSDPSPGMADQATALQWVKQNIATFGGDPDNVTLFGQSAGGFSIAALLNWGHGGKLFRRAILQSGASGLARNRAQAEEVSAMFLEELGEDPHTAGPDAFVAAQGRLARKRKQIADWMPISPDKPVGELVDMLGGWTKDDALPFVLLHAGVTPGNGTERDYAAQTGRLNAMFEDGCRAMAAAVAAKDKNAWLYRFDWSDPASHLGACHCIELPFLLGGEQSWRAAPALGNTPWAEIDAVGKTLRGAWANFARGEAPGPAWRTGELTILP